MLCAWPGTEGFEAVCPQIVSRSDLAVLELDVACRDNHPRLIVIAQPLRLLHRVRLQLRKIHETESY